MSMFKSVLHALAFVTFGMLSLVAWEHHSKSKRLPPAEELTGSLAEWRETPKKNSRGAWFLEFEFRTREHPCLFKIDRMVYSSRFRCADCPGLKDPGKEGYSRSQRFGENEKTGATLRFLADSKGMKEARPSVEIYALKTDRETYLVPKDYLDYLRLVGAPARGGSRGAFLLFDPDRAARRHADAGPAVPVFAAGPLAWKVQF